MPLHICTPSSGWKRLLEADENLVVPLNICDLREVYQMKIGHGNIKSNVLTGWIPMMVERRFSLYYMESGFLLLPGLSTRPGEINKHLNSIPHPESKPPNLVNFL